MAARSTRASDNCVGRAKFRKFVTTAPSASVSCRMPSTYGWYCGGQRGGIDQLAVAVDRRQAVAKLVRDPGGQLAEPCQRFLQPKLLFEMRDRGEIREQADDAAAARPRC